MSMKGFIRTNISPQVTSLYNRLGFADRNNIAGHLNAAGVSGQTALIQRLKDQGVLKSGVDPASLSKVQPFMLNPIKPAEMEAIMPGATGPLNNITQAMEAGYSGAVTEMLADPMTELPLSQQAANMTPMTYAHTKALGPALAIGATLLALPAAALGAAPVDTISTIGSSVVDYASTHWAFLTFGAGTVYSVLSHALVNRNPNGALHKFWVTGQKVSGLIIAGSLIAMLKSMYSHNYMFVDMIHSVFSGWGLLAIFAGGLVTTLAGTKLSVNRAIKKVRAASVDPLTELYIRKVFKWANLKIWGGLQYMGYRSLIYLAFVSGFLWNNIGHQLLSPESLPHLILAMTMAVGIGWRFLVRGSSAENWANGIRDFWQNAMNRAGNFVGIKDTVIVPVNDIKYITVSGVPLVSSSGIKDKRGKVRITVTDSSSGEAKVFIYGNPVKMAKNVKEYAEKILKEEDKNLIKAVEDAAKSVFRKSKASYDFPIFRVGTEVVLDKAFKYLPFLAGLAIAPFNPDISAMSLLASYGTIGLGAWTLGADAQSTLHSLVSAENNKRSALNVGAALISDADKNRTNDFVVRLVAYIRDVERNFSKVVNTLIMDTPHVEVQNCAENNPLDNVDMLRSCRAAREVFAEMKRLQDENHLKFQDGYRESRLHEKDPVSTANRLADTLGELGELYCNEDAKGSFVAHIKKLMEDDKKRAKPDRWFDIEGEESYMREALKAIKGRGLKFIQKADEVRAAAKGGYISQEEVEAIYREMLGVFSVKNNHIIRRIDAMDERMATKIYNLSFTQTHIGDTMYQVWRLIEENGKTEFRIDHIPTSYVRMKNPKYDHLYDHVNGKSIALDRKSDEKKYMWVRRQDFLKVLGVSQSAADDLKYVDNSPEGMEKSKVNISAGGHKLNIDGYFTDEETLIAPKRLIDWEGKEAKEDKNTKTWIAGQELAKADEKKFKEAFRGWAREHYGKNEDYGKDKNETEKTNYGKWLKGLPKGVQEETIWFIDKPEALIISPTVNYNVSDEGYIVLNTERQLSAELNDTKKKHKLLSVVNSDEFVADVSNPDPSRPLNHVVSWDVRDAEAGLEYTVNGKQFSIPYAENRQLITKLNDDFKGLAVDEIIRRVDHGRIVNENGKDRIDVYTKGGKVMGTMDTAWPAHMHPAGMIDGARVDIKLYPKRMGRATWLVADYGESYAADKNNPVDHERFRYVRLDFDKEAKQRFFKNFIVSVQAYDKDRRLKIKTASPKNETYPVDRAIAGIDEAEQVEVLEVSSSADSYIYNVKEGGKIKHIWSPKETKGAERVKGGILIVKGKDGTEDVVHLADLPSGLGLPEDARNTISVEKNGDKLVFNKLRMKDRIKDDPTFIYSLAEDLHGIAAGADSGYKKLSWILNNQDVTARITGTRKTGYKAELYDENGQKLDIDFNLGELKDADGKSFLSNENLGMTSKNSFYQSSDSTITTDSYKGREEFRPRLIKVNGKIKMVLTRVDKVTVARTRFNKSMFDALPEGTSGSKIYFSIPTSAMKLKVGDRTEWVPLSLSQKVSYRPPNNFGVAKVKGKNGDQYHRIQMPKDLGDETLFVKYDKKDKKFYEYKFAPKKDFIAEKDPFEKVRIREVSHEADVKIRAALAKEGIFVEAGAYLEEEEARVALAKKANKPIPKHDQDDIEIDVVHTKNPSIIDGEFQSVVHGQRQFGTAYAREMYLASEQAQLRDERFYGVTREPHSEVIPANGEPRSFSIQQAKDNNFDMNGKFAGDGIENGAPFVDKHHHLLEFVESTMGLPKDAMAAYAPYLKNRTGGYDRRQHAPNHIKLALYGRELGWLSGVSEDEQGKLALNVLLGHRMKYYIGNTAFESQPNTPKQVSGQDDSRYPSATALGLDVMVDQITREYLHTFPIFMKMANATMKSFIEFLCFLTWYKWSWAKLGRKAAPFTHLATHGEVTGYFFDSFFFASYFTNLFTDFKDEVGVRTSLNRTKQRTGTGPFVWTAIKAPAMLQAFHWTAFEGMKEKIRKGWQYGPFVTTALMKAGDLPKANKAFLRYMYAGTMAALIYGAAYTAGGMAVGVLPGLAFFINMFWGMYSMAEDMLGVHYLKRFERENPKASFTKYAGSDDTVKAAYEAIDKGESKEDVEKKLNAITRGKKGKAWVQSENVRKAIEKYWKENRKAIDFRNTRAKAVPEIDNSQNYWFRKYYEALNLARSGNIPEAKRKLKIVLDMAEDKSHDEDLTVMLWAERLNKQF
ncbi:hypothetical protein ACFLZ2_01855 [Candidatus Margulisiibacteriota bacterium]